MSQVDIVLRPKGDAPVVTLASLNAVITRCRPNDTMTALLRRNEYGSFVIRISVTEGRVRHCASELIEQLVGGVSESLAAWSSCGAEGEGNDVTSSPRTSE